MIPFNHSKRAVETFLVAGSAALYNTAGSGNNLTDSNGNVILTDGQLGIFSTSVLGGTVANNVATDGTPTITEAPSIAIYQGTPESTTSQSAVAVYPLYVRPYERSEDLEAGTQVFVTKQVYAAPKSSTWTVGVPTAATSGDIIPLDLTEYQMAFSYRGRIVDMYYGPEAAAYDRFTFVTPNYTALATAEPLDHLLQNLAAIADRNSRAIKVTPAIQGKSPFIVFAVASAATGTLISGMTAGVFVPVINTASGVKGFTPNADQVASIQAAATASGFTRILTIDTLTAGTATGGIAEGLMVLALDRNLAYIDKIPSVKIAINVTLPAGFDTSVYYNEHVQAFEGQGVGRALDLQYRATHGQRLYSLNHTEDPVIQFPSPISLTGTYNTYVIQHSHANAIGIAQVSVSPYKEIILVPTSNTTLSSATGTTGALDNALNAWLASNGSPVITII